MAKFTIDKEKQEVVMHELIRENSKTYFLQDTRYSNIRMRTHFKKAKVFHTREEAERSLIEYMEEFVARERRKCCDSKKVDWQHIFRTEDKIRELQKKHLPSKNSKISLHEVKVSNL